MFWGEKYKKNVFTRNFSTEKEFENFYKNSKFFSWSFDTLYGYTNPFDILRLNRLFDKVININPKRVLDVGCGSGLLIRKLSEKKIYCYGVDVAKALLKKIKTNDYLILKEASAYQLPFKSNYFDLVICSEVIEHLPNYPLALKEIFRVTTPSGIVIFSIPNLFCYDSLEAKFKLITRLLSLSKKIFHKNPYPYGWNTHINKNTPMGWKKKLEEYHFKVTEDYGVYIFPYIPEFFKPLKFLERKIILSIFPIFEKLDRFLSNKKLFKCFGQTHIFICSVKK